MKLQVIWQAIAAISLFGAGVSTVFLSGHAYVITVALGVSFVVATWIRISVGRRELGLTKSKSKKLWDEQSPPSNNNDTHAEGVGYSDTASANHVQKSISVSELVALMIVDPSSTIERITQHVEPLTRALHVNLHLHLQLPPTKHEGFVELPILIPKKGTLFDDFELHSGGVGGNFSPSHDTTMNRIAQTIKDLVESSGHGDAYHKHYEEYITSVIGHHMTGNNTVDQSYTSYTELQIAHFRQVIRSNGESSVDESERKRISDLVASMITILTGSYPIFISVELHENQVTDLTIRIQYRLLQRRSTLTKDLFGRAFDKLRWAVGARSSTFEIPLDLARSASSFHLEFMGPKGHYLMKQHIEPSVKTAKYSYLRLRRLMGQRYGHVYSRRWDSAPGFKVVSQFNERMPGSIGSALLTSIGTVIAVFCSAYSISRDSTHGDLSVLLLALPAAAAGWFTFDRDGALLSRTLASTVSTFSCFLAAATALILLFVDQDPVSQIAGFDYWWWSVLIGSICICILTVSSWLRRTIIEATVIGSEHREGWNEGDIAEP